MHSNTRASSIMADRQRVENVIQSLRTLQEPSLSIIRLSEPISAIPTQSNRTSDASSSAFDNASPASLEADLSHYKVRKTPCCVIVYLCYPPTFLTSLQVLIYKTSTNPQSRNSSQNSASPTSNKSPKRNSSAPSSATHPKSLNRPKTQSWKPNSLK